MGFVADTSAVRCRGDKPFSIYPQANQIEYFTSLLKGHSEGFNGNSLNYLRVANACDAFTNSRSVLVGSHSRLLRLWAAYSGSVICSNPFTVI